MKLMTIINDVSRTLLGYVARPALTATATGGAVYVLGHALDNGVLTHPAAVIGSGVVVAGVTEGLIIGFGRDSKVRATTLSAQVSAFLETLESIKDEKEKAAAKAAFLGGLDVDLASVAEAAMDAAEKKAAANG